MAGSLLRDGHVTFRWRDSAGHNAQKVMTIRAVELIPRFLLHVLPPGFVKIRHFGLLANGCRCEGLKLASSLLRAMPVATLLTVRQRRAIERKCLPCCVGTLCFLGYIPVEILAASLSQNQAEFDSS